MNIQICKMTSDMLKDYLDLLSKDFDSIVYTEASMKLINDEKYISLAALKDGELIGGVVVEKFFDPVRLPNKIYFVKHLVVKEEMRGQGVGRKLLNHIEKLARENNTSRIELTCANFRTESHKFYEANGFTVKKTKVFIKEF